MEKITRISELEKYESEIVLLLTQYGDKKWTRVARNLSFNHQLDIRPYQIKRLYNKLLKTEMQAGVSKDKAVEVLNKWAEVVFPILNRDWI